jgi:GNAT superfamily N-acetyltransferase
VRLRRPTHAAAYSAAPLLLLAAPSLEAVLGDRLTARRAAEAAFRSDRTVWGHRWALGADHGGRMAGLAIAFPGRRYGSLALGTGVTLARAAGPRHAADLAKRGRILNSLVAPVRKETLFVSALAVDPEHRKRGIGTALLERVIGGADSLGLGVALDVAVEDEDARRLYEGMGFKQVDERRTTPADRKLVPAEGLARLERL